MTEIQNLVLAALETTHDWMSPTNIAHIVWNDTRHHSAWASPICLRMVKAGLILRNKRGWYKIKSDRDREGRHD